MGRRYRLKAKPGAYVERGRGGRFKKWTPIERSIPSDAARLAGRPAKPGYGHRGDYQYRGIPLRGRSRRRKSLAGKILKGY
jgi:hypothetical protein